MSDLVAFLRARLDEEQMTVAANLAAADMMHSDELVIAAVTRDEGVRPVCDYDPARVLREVEAMRKILDGHQQWSVDGKTGCNVCGPDREICLTLRMLAAIWRDHPDYDPAWA